MTNNTYLKVVGIGAIAGMRSMSAPALVSYSTPAGQLSGSYLQFMTHRSVVVATGLAAVGELVADKLPGIPARTSAGPLIGRALSGALCGATIARAEGKDARTGALLGLASAIGSTFAFYHLRRSFGRYAPDTVLGFAEDALVVGLGSQLAAGRRE